MSDNTVDKYNGSDTKRSATMSSEVDYQKRARTWVTQKFILSDKKFEIGEPYNQPWLKKNKLGKLYNAVFKND